MKCIIIDDEPNAIDVLKRYVEQVSYIQLAGTFRNPLKALEYLKEAPVDLIFLDINMPKINGLQFLRSLANKPLVIFTTAYSEYAVESYEVNAVDYLVKPIEFDRFLKAINKVSDLQNLQNKKGESYPQKEHEYLLLKSGPQIHKVKTNDILFIEKEENYIVFNIIDKKIFVRANMNDIFDLVPGNDFIRVHKSFVVNLKNINTVEPHQVTINKNKIPVSNTYREEFLKKLKK